MKRILVVGATLLVASSAYGFAKVANHMITASVSTTPVRVNSIYLNHTVRAEIKPETSAKTAPAIAASPLAEQPEKISQDSKQIATAFATPNAPTTASNPDGPSPAYQNTFLPTTDTFDTTGNIAPDFTPKHAIETQRVSFERLSMIGVYR